VSLGKHSDTPAPGHAPCEWCFPEALHPFPICALSTVDVLWRSNVSPSAAMCTPAGELQQKEGSKLGAKADFAKLVALNLFHFMVSGSWRSADGAACESQRSSKLACLEEL